MLSLLVTVRAARRRALSKLEAILAVSESEGAPDATLEVPAHE